MTWLAPVGLAALILLASVQCWPAGLGRWPPRLREQALLAVAWLGAALMAPICWPLAVILGLTLYRDRSTASPAVRTWAVACLLWAITATIPSPWRWLVVAAYVASAIGQCGLLGYQAILATRMRLNYHDLRNALHGSMGTRFFCGLLIAQAIPLAPLWALPILAVGLMLSSSATALLAAAAGMWLTYPTQALPIVLGAGLVGVVVMALRKGWRNVLRLSAFGDGLRERTLLWRLTAARWSRVSWRERLLGGGHDAFSRQGRWWARIDGPMNRVHLHACNDGIQSFLDVGLIGALALASLVGITLSHGAVGDPLTGTIVAILVGSIFQFPLHVAHMAVPSLILLALLASA